MNGVFNAALDDNGDPKLYNSTMYYWREDEEFIMLYDTQIPPSGWATFHAEANCKGDDGIKVEYCYNGFHYLQTDQRCPLTQMTSRQTWSLYTVPTSYPLSEWRSVPWYEVLKLTDRSMIMTCEDDLDECSAKETNDCPDNANCVNTYGGYDCVCKSGETCVDFNQCDVNGGAVCPDGLSCLEGSSLTDKDKGYSCGCLPGFKFNEKTKVCESPCPADTCWEYDHAAQTCTFKQSCVDTSTFVNNDCDHVSLPANIEIDLTQQKPSI